MRSEYRPLFEPYRFRSGVEVKNRLVMAPMTNFSAYSDGTVSNEEVDYYARRAGGVGMVVTACVYGTPNGKGFPGEFAADRDEMIPSLERLAGSIREKGAKAVLQIFHGGRECKPVLVPNGDVVGASAVSSEQNPEVLPRELTETEIESIVRDFGEMTRRAIEAGYDGVELHGANGYLIQQFYSPHANRREDRWGGDIERRLRFPLAVVDEVKRVVRERAERPFLIGYRFSPEEATTPGITMEETFRLLDELATKELDYVHVSQNDFRSRPRRGADDSLTRLEWVRQRIGHLVPVIGVGAVKTPEDAVEALATGIELVAIGRELIIDPDWAQKVESGRQDEVETKLDPRGKDRLKVPGPLWESIVRVPGWFPIGD
ncbi:NADH-dependent flavin oxidoreductase [Cohnella fermenti]|uniref:NADH-dependent flavin oxidoreductase n=1 Tax=Cohnella fermenti TaxID=2565925 RepID=A0A4S4CA39_9BACL|nr:NADH-dependent flavin oxidoreductase [Cohnella fermenti]THF84256.1 NADH-dependent flavin oxidoreductase [Cohnella fermenti]